MKNVLKYIFGFHFISILGVIVGIILYDIQSESNPLSSFLTAPSLYLIALLVTGVIHFILWISVDKATSYNMKGRVLGFITDYFILIACILSTAGSLFMMNTFL